MERKVTFKLIWVVLISLLMVELASTQLILPSSSSLTVHVLPTIAVAVTPTPHNSSECSNYKFLIESNRARTYFNTSTVLCDTSLSGWYRFSGRAGNQMADSCVDYKHCGTAAPGWMNGSHPSVAERVVSRSVCFRSRSNCCKWSIVISVRNCGGFYVYWLQRPPHCNFRYCGSGIQPTSVTVPTTAQSTHSSVCPHLILSETSGVITSPNFPLNYPENQTCSWQIIARKGKRVKLVIQSLEIQYCRACSCDYLEIENASFADGTPNKKRECGVFFGNITYYSQQDRLRVLFVSDSSQWARGFTAVYTQVPYNTSNECSNYRFLDEINRAITYSNISSWPCDTNLLAGWYRFSGGAGSQMADFCVSDLFRKYCSTDAPGWLSGGHPSVAEGVVRRKVCFPGAIRGCCGYGSDISVRNCGSFFVYKLLPPPHCYLRYCGNGLPLARECLNYRVLNESNRAVSYSNSTSHCTDTTLSGWYRFSGEAGYQMADSCVNMSHCGTMFPGWLTGGHPGVVEGVVQRKVCFTNFLGCCGASIYINVRNCGSYYVYKLMPLPSCRRRIRTRYCGNRGALTPTSTTSVSSSTPPLMPTTKPLVPTTNETTINPTTAKEFYTPLTIAENKELVLNCTMYGFDGKHEWSRKDGEPAVTATRILTEDTRLNITDASVEDAGEYICRNGPTVTHRFVVTVEVFVKVQMIVKVLNYEYTPELKNKSSPAYKATEKNFTAEMDKLYKNTPGYVRTEVLNFTKGSVNVDFRVIIVINAIDPKNASAIPDAKAETTHQVVREAKTGFVKQLQVSPVVEVFSPPLEPRGIEIFEEKSDKLGVRWEPSEDADAFKVESYHVQYRELLTKIPQNASVPSTEKKDTYSYLIKDLEPKTTYMIRVGAENRHGINFNEERAHKTLAPPFAEWIIVLIVLGILLVTGIIVGLIVFTRRRAEQRRRRLEEEGDGRFGGLSGDVRLASVPKYETRNVKGIKFSFANKSFMPSEANWKEIPYEKITLMNELGSGAFGVVYKGELKQDNGNVTPCAVKTLKESATTEEIRDLYNELEIMTNVGNHPNLVNLLGACTENGHLLVVIEIAENGNLLEFLRKSRETNQNYGNIQGTVLTSDTRLRIAADVAKGMAHLANGRWIHRDLAARNVLLAKNYVAKVADYGMARDIYEQLMYKKETQGKLPVKWMAIESLETYIFTTESDVWSYGVLLWEMESGGLKPYAGLSTTELIDQLKKGYRLEKPDGCSDAVYQIMRDCWNPNPKSRPTFDDLVTRLENMAVSS